MRASARRLLLRFGGEYLFQRYSVTPDWEEGREVKTPSGGPILAAAAKDSQTFDTSSTEGDRKVRKAETVLHVEFQAFEEHGGLSEEWTVFVEGVERRIASALMAEDETYYVARFADVR